MIEFSPVSTEIHANWHDGVLYCQFLEIDGKKGWRLPTHSELYSLESDIVDSNTLSGKWLWTSSESSDLLAYVIGFDFSYPPMSEAVSKQSLGNIRAVRNIC